MRKGGSHPTQKHLASRAGDSELLEKHCSFPILRVVEAGDLQTKRVVYLLYLGSAIYMRVSLELV